MRLALTLAAFGLAAAQLNFTPSQGNVTAVYDVLERVLPGSSSHFTLSIAQTCAGIPAGTACFTVAEAGGRVSVAGTTASEVAAGVGTYLREVCNMTLGWTRGGGSNVYIPSSWPTVGTPIVRNRIVPFSYIENVCTHSYSLVWYTWDDWTRFIDWMALTGVNLALAPTGQELIQYKVFQQLGLDDLTIRSWFNGPAFLTWSRGQNEYGNNIAGPLPMSWMQSQWDLQRSILARYRQLGIMFQLPGFQGNVPWALSAKLKDSNMTQQGDTGWMDSLDPVFGMIADLYMKQLCSDFGCDAAQPFFQMDGYFNGGTAPWVSLTDGSATAEQSNEPAPHPYGWITQGIGKTPSPRAAVRVPRITSTEGADLPQCTWSSIQPGTYLAGCDDTKCASYPTVAAAQVACVADVTCGGITSQSGGTGPWEIRLSAVPAASPSGEASYYISNYDQCRPPPPPITPDPLWMKRGVSAYTGLNRTVPGAVWFMQGWAFVDWSTPQQGSSLRGFVESTPPGMFVITDMSVDGTGEWQKWNFAAYWGAPFVWTSLHDFGGTDALKGDLQHANAIPFCAMEATVDNPTCPPNTELASNTTVWGTGYTPEGIDQNPVYYEFLNEANFRTAPVDDVTGHIITRAHRRYGLTSYNADVATVWSLLVNSSYAQDLSVQDPTGIPHLPGSSSQFEADRVTPTPRLCLEWQAWGKMVSIATSGAVNATREPFRYDLVNLGREMLAQLSTPVSQNFSDAINAAKLNSATITATGNLYIQLLADVDTLVATDSAFLIGPWLAMARAWGNGTDCVINSPSNPIDCASFMEWNARSQLTTWNPTGKGATSVPGGPLDYASKHWSGLINDYYKVRAAAYQSIALGNAAAGQPLNKTATAAAWAQIAYTFQNAYPSTYPLTPQGDAVAVSQAMYNKYAPFYAACN